MVVDTVHRTISIVSLNFSNNFSTAVSPHSRSLPRCSAVYNTIPLAYPKSSRFWPSSPQSSAQMITRTASLRPHRLPPAFSEAAVFISDVLERFATRGRALWPLVPSTLHAACMANETNRHHHAELLVCFPATMRDEILPPPTLPRPGLRPHRGKRQRPLPRRISLSDPPDSTDRVRDRARRCGLAAACGWSLTLGAFHLSVGLGIAGEGAGGEAVGLRGQDASTSSGL